MFTPPPSPLPRFKSDTTTTTTGQPGASEMNPFEESLGAVGKRSSSSSSLLEVPESVSTTPTSPKSIIHTPPPTLPSSPSFHTPTFSKAQLALPVPSPHSSRDEPKRRLASRLKWASLLIPLSLIVLTLTTRWSSHPAIMDFFGVVQQVQDHQHPDSHSLFEIHKRHPSPQLVADVSVSVSSNSSSSSPTPTPTVSTAQSVPTIPSSPPVLPTPFPQPWDQSGLSLNFSTQGCFNFFQNMTNTDPFRSCRSFAMLSAWSSSFTAAQTNLTLLNSILWGTCNPPLGVDQCTTNMRWFEREMVQDGVCGKEMEERNELVVRTRAALLAYPILQTAACLPLSTTNTYCYVSSINAGASGASDIYLYSLPLGINFPSSAQASCGACEKNLLTVFGNAVLDTDDTSSVIGLKGTYDDAVNVIEGKCGQGFVQAAQGLHSSSAAPVVGLQGKKSGSAMWGVLVGVVVVLGLMEGELVVVR
ncbi:hypothetical protein K435DRAFT_897708 [Dendrothele bispora CBS 962.96]|uniref:DUF7729 domain-containing protein n=1 Tax=Dendrothele bispora (strain CBS 962.96) TaxID=1314807 RepID=A0A4S8LZQ0_DENBC|nr:hypothetical protein K435DRAFT_897708 [Dendrothele bispora CBS 962.96]